MKSLKAALAQKYREQTSEVCIYDKFSDNHVRVI